MEKGQLLLVKNFCDVSQVMIWINVDQISVLFFDDIFANKYIRVVFLYKRKLIS